MSDSLSPLEILVACAVIRRAAPRARSAFPSLCLGHAWQAARFRCRTNLRAALKQLARAEGLA